jgi:CheY-like chemotaxis protein
VNSEGPVLIVDDDEDSRVVYSAALNHASIGVVAASDGVEGMECIRVMRPRVVLLDIQMPGMDGFGVLRALREDRDTARAQVIAITGHAMRHEREQLHAAGFDVVLFKPIDPRAVVLAVREALLA